MSEWISVKDRMPDVHRSVLVKADAYHVAQLVFNDKSSKTWGVVDSMYWVVVNDCWMPLSQVTHWMPLPKPPSTMQPPSEPVSGVVIRDGCPTLLLSKYIKSTDIRLYTQPPLTVSLEQYNKLLDAHREINNIKLANEFGGTDPKEQRRNSNNAFRMQAVSNTVIAEAERSAK